MGPVMWGWVGGQRGESRRRAQVHSDRRQHQRKLSWYLSAKVVLNEDELLLCPRPNGPWQTVTITPPPLSGKAWPNLWRWYTLPGSSCRFTFLRRRNIYVSGMCLLRALGLECFRRLGTSILETAPYNASLILSACSPEGPVPVPTLWCMSICRVYEPGQAVEDRTNREGHLSSHRYRMESVSAWRQDLKTFGPLYHSAVMNGFYRGLSYRRN